MLKLDTTTAPFGFEAKILLDSVAPSKRRLTTWELTYPRFIHAELMTHRLFSRNSASSRAIPVEKMHKRIREMPAMFVWWGKNQAGMQAMEEVEDIEGAKQWWLEGRDLMLAHAQKGAELGLHKQIVNRITEPWMYITVVMSSTYHGNLFHLRDHWMAQPEFQQIAKIMRPAYEQSIPTPIDVGGWHLPFITGDDWDEAGNLTSLNHGQSMEMMKKVAVGRCARVSYLTQDGKRDLVEDIKLHDRLCKGPETGDPGHWSPFEHVAQALETPERSGNFIGWKQYRKFFKDEHFGEPMP